MPRRGGNTSGLPWPDRGSSPTRGAPVLKNSTQPGSQKAMRSAISAQRGPFTCSATRRMAGSTPRNHASTAPLARRTRSLSRSAASSRSRKAITSAGAVLAPHRTASAAVGGNAEATAGRHLPQSAGSPSKARARKASFAASPPLQLPAATQRSRHALSLQRRDQSLRKCGPGGAGGAGVTCRAQPTRLRPSAGHARLAKLAAAARDPLRRRGRRRHGRHRL